MEEKLVVGYRKSSVASFFTWCGVYKKFFVLRYQKIKNVVSEKSNFFYRPLKQENSSKYGPERGLQV